MAQTRYYNWKDDDLTDSLNHALIGVIPPGLYRGFDADLADNGAGFDLTLKHTTNGSYEVDQALALKTGIGVAVTKQGVVIKEDAPVVLPITPNVSGFGRTDLIVIEHEYQQIVGGSTALYKVIQGTPGPLPLPPALTVPNKQIAIGALYIPTGANLGSATTRYFKVQNPDFGGDVTTMHTDVEQTVTGRKSINAMVAPPEEATYLLGPKYLVTTAERNFYFINHVSDEYLVVKNFLITLPLPDVFVPLKGEPFVFVTQQKLKIQGQNSGGGSVIYTPDGEDVIIEAGETFTLRAGYGMFSVMTQNFLLEKGGEGLRESMNKWGGTQMLAMSRGDYSPGATVGRLDVPRDGNTLVLLNSHGITGLDFIQSYDKADKTVGNDHYRSGNGTRLLLINQSGNDITINNEIAGPPAGYKSIILDGGAGLSTINLLGGGLMELIEAEDGWHVVGTMMLTYNVFSILQQLQNLSLEQLIDVDFLGGSPAFLNYLYYNGAVWTLGDLIATINSIVETQPNYFVEINGWNIGFATYDIGNSRINFTGGNHASVNVGAGGGDLREILDAINGSHYDGTWLSIKIVGTAGGTLRLDYTGGGVNDLLKVWADGPDYTILTVGDEFKVIKTSTGWVVMLGHKPMTQWMKMSAPVVGIFDSGWTDGSTDAEYRKNGDGMVSIRGEALSTAFVSNKICTLPVGYRPPHNMYINAVAGGANAVLHVLASGGVFLMGYTSGSIGVEFSGVHFYTDTF